MNIDAMTEPDLSTIPTMRVGASRLMCHRTENETGRAIEAILTEAGRKAAWVAIHAGPLDPLADFMSDETTSTRDAFGDLVARGWVHGWLEATPDDYGTDEP